MSIRINDWFIAGNAQKTNSDWNAESGYAQILNKPTNLAHTTGDEVLSGIKTFSSIPLSVTPETSSNDTSVATTEFVSNKIAQHSGDNSAHNDIRQSITSVSNSIAPAIEAHNISNASHSDIRQAIIDVNSNISTEVGNHNNNTLAHSDIRQAINNNNVLISSVSDDLIQETTQRNSDVNELQKQIDALSSKGDITDIVGTYQDLLDYDTSTLLNKSIIKVLTDSTHDNASSYYKWNTNTSAFEYVGSESPTYNKTEIDEIDNTTVHKTGNETIAGTKTFTSNIFSKDTGKIGTTTNQWGRMIQFQDSDGTRLARIQPMYVNTTTLQMGIYASNGDLSENGIWVRNNGETYAPSPATGSNNNNIATTAWISDPTLSTNIVHRTGDETISGVKTFNNTITAPTPSSATDNSTNVATTAWVISHNAVDTNLVHRSGDETITGTKTFSNNVKSGKEFISTTSGTYGQFRAICGSYGFFIRNDGNNTHFLLTDADNQYGTDNALRPWAVNNSTGNVSCGTVWSFSQTIQGTAYRAQWGDLAEHYITDEQYPKGTLVQFGGEKEITIAKNKVNAVITSEPGFILNGEMKDSQAIALIGRVPVRVIGKVKKFDKIALSYIDGVGCSNNDSENPIGISLEDKNDSDEGLILCSVKLSF